MDRAGGCGERPMMMFVFTGVDIVIWVFGSSEDEVCADGFDDHRHLRLRRHWRGEARQD